MKISSSRSVLVLTVLLSGTASVNAQRSNDDPAQWQSRGRVSAYMHDLVGPGALLGIALGTGLDHLQEEPPEWGNDAGGFGRRAASNAGRHVVNQSVRHALAVAMGRSTRYQFCDCTALGARVGHAFVETLTDRNRAGDRMIAIPRFAGAYAGAFAERTWHPNMTATDALVDGTRSILWGVVSNVAKEILQWPK